MTKAQILKKYIKFRRLSNKSRGIKDIEFHINKFITSTKKPLANFDEVVLVDYLDKISKKYTISTLNTLKSSYIKNFIKWHFEDWSLRFRHLDKICKTEKPGETYTSEEMLSEDDFEKMMKDEDSTFWKAYFMTLFYGGCRPGEVCKLKWKDIEFVVDGAYVTIYSKKNKKSFIKFVPSDVAFRLKKLKKYTTSDYVFENERTKKIASVKTAYKRLRDLSEKVLGKRVNLYLLRHSIATIIYNKDDIKDDDLAKQMGHSKSMKETYQHNNREKLKEIARKIYISPEDDLPLEKKHELEIKIEQLEKDSKFYKKVIGEMNDKYTMIIKGLIAPKKKGKKLKVYNSILSKKEKEFLKNRRSK